MIFPALEHEETVQVNDRTRLHAGGTFKSPDEAAFSLVRIKPEVGAAWYTVSGDLSDQSSWYLDWSYATAGAKVVTVEATTNGSATEKTFSTTVLSVADDNLFSSDQDLKGYEPDVMDWLKAGRNTFKDVHRAAQTTIMEHLDREGIVDVNDQKLTKAAVVDITEVREWSKFVAMRLLMEGRVNQVDDIWSKKAKVYFGLEQQARNRAVLRLDLNGDESADTDEEIDHDSGSVFRR